MRAGSFGQLTQDKENTTQVTFHYVEGHTETFTIPIPASEFQEEVLQLLNQPWLTFHLVDQTVFICTARLIKVEIKPAIPELQGQGIFSNSMRVSTMQRAASGRLPMNT
ncbi:MULTISPECIES: hypothetical protein [Microcoleaceae]|uniref:hypothetical protein n=1 Tax=Microcoleaceae TaxID=1892252 RepID=UPI0018814103|nr:MULTISPECIES: hypothetical protein [unclassified Tychonema]MBE9123119.1 hypothetical protein [Tychonema sp. LEGE 07199]MBE9132140.1 hypothetical protein [Tychonema sp. LEGE 07196]MBE9162757.1 hypothetical protein [Tychonema sp. LEGE 06208]